MINLNPIPKKIQERMLEKMKALGRETSSPLSNSDSNRLTAEKINSRTTFIKMVSGHINSVTLMGGRLKENRDISQGFEDIYGPVVYKETDEEVINRHAADIAKDDIAAGLNIKSGKGKKARQAWNAAKFGPKAAKLPNDAKRPMPGIKSIDVSFRGGLKAHRECTISWTCWSFEELMQLMPHFLAHGKTVMVQWGWIYDKFSLLNVPSFLRQAEGKTFIDGSAFDSNFQKEVIESKGDFDMVTGVIKNFEFSTREDGGFECSTVLTSLGVNMMSNPDGALGSLSPTVTYMLSKNDTDDKAKIQEATKDIQEAGLTSDGSKLINLNATVSLKLFLGNIDLFINENIGFNLKTGFGPMPSNIENIEKGVQKNKIVSDRNIDAKGTIYHVPNKYIYMTREARVKAGQGYTTSWLDDIWVRWGWFEDNILSKFLTVTSGEGSSNPGTVLTEFRSVENKLDKDGKPIIGNAGPVYESTRIKSHKEMQTLSLRDYILPGKFSPQAESFSIKLAGMKKAEVMQGDIPEICQLATIINDTENFPPFEVGAIPTGPDGQEIKQQKSGKKRYYYYVDPGDKNKGTKFADDIMENANTTNTSSKFGYMRNMLINTKAIKEAFGVGGEFNVESINILEALESLFEILNSKLRYWDFKLISDEVETNRIKIIDETTTWLNFGAPIDDQKTKFDTNGEVTGKPGVFYFPIWRNDSIVSSQTLTAKIPTSMQLAAMYGANMDVTKDQSKNSYLEAGAKAAGGLYNKSRDNRNAGLNMAFVNVGTENIGNENGLEDEPITKEGGLDIKTFIIKNSSNLVKGFGDKLTDIAEKLKAAAGGGADVFYDSSKPSPFFDSLTAEQKQELLNSDKAKKEIKKATAGDKEKKLPRIDAKFKTLFTSKYDINLDMRSPYVQTVNTLINMWDKDNTADTKPLNVLFDLELVVDGIGGISPGNSFHSTYLPVEYQTKSVFQAKDVNHTVDASGWKTTISGLMRSTVGKVLSDVTVDEEKQGLFDNLKGEVVIAEQQKADPKTQVANKVEKISDIQRYNLEYMSNEKYLKAYGTTRDEDWHYMSQG
jgi:hypothetical protein